MRSYEDLRAAYPWRQIPGCPGRLVLTGGPSLLSPRDIAGAETEFPGFRSPRAADPVYAARICGGGLISYRKADGRFVHTLGDEEGFARKMAELGIPGPASADSLDTSSNCDGEFHRDSATGDIPRCAFREGYGAGEGIPDLTERLKPTRRTLAAPPGREA